MRAILNTLVDELNRLKASGVRTVNVSDESLSALKRAIARYAKPAPAAAASPRGAEQHASLLGTPSAPPSANFLPVPEPTTGSAPKPQPPRREAPRHLPPPPSLVPPEGSKAERMGWLNDKLHSDPTCLAQVRPGRKLVLGVGSLDADILFIGEAPGAEEEIQGEPFVGPAGQLLTKMIAAMGLNRDQVYIGNIMKWRPQLPPRADGSQVGNREPTEEEMNYCLPFLQAQIDIIQPKLLVGLGATAAKGMLGHGKVKTLGDVRRRWHEYLGRPLLITYHPSYLLRKETEGKQAERKAKRIAWEDFLMVMEKAALPISDKQRGHFL